MRMPCTHLESCELFPTFTLHATARIWQIRFCEGDFARCERYKLAVIGKPVPRTLLPNGKSLDLAGAAPAIAAAAPAVAAAAKK